MHFEKENKGFHGVTKRDSGAPSPNSTGFFGKMNSSDHPRSKFTKSTKPVPENAFKLTKEASTR